MGEIADDHAFEFYLQGIMDAELDYVKEFSLKNNNDLIEDARGLLCFKKYFCGEDREVVKCILDKYKECKNLSDDDRNNLIKIAVRFYMRMDEI